MPKTPGRSFQSFSSVLGRNQACHRCRKKKLRCDAAKPCSACIKAHAYAVKYNSASALEPIDCSYEPPDELTTLRDIIVRLQTEIAELKEKLKEKDSLLALCRCGMARTVDVPACSRTADVTLPGINTGALPLAMEPLAPLPVTSVGPQPLEQPRVGCANISLFLGSMGPPPQPAFEQPTTLMTEFDPSNFMVMDRLWPFSLPPPDVLQHLAETFFAAVPLASRVIHKPTFMANLQQPPSHANFPQLSLLHSICALASIYTPVDRDSPLDNEVSARHVRFFHCGLVPYAQECPFAPTEQYTKTDYLTINPKMGFGATHIRWAQWAAAALKLATGYDHRPLQVIQAAIIAAWYNYSTGFHLNLYSSLAVINRTLLPLGLNTAPGSEPLSRMTAKHIMLLPGPWKRPFREIPRNLYWMAFSMERICTVPTPWPLLISEEDSSQLMPCTFDDFFDLNDVPLQGRQKLNSPDFIKTHPPEFTDSFSLYIKGSVLIGRVKVFNGRFRNRYSTIGDPRETTEFQMLDNAIMSYLESIPQDLKDPVYSGPDGKLDAVLYTAHLLPHTAAILLHDPHANLSCSGCHSAKRLLTAAWAILDLISKLSATSNDLLYLDHACSVTWLVAGVVLVRFMKAAMEMGNGEDAVRLKQGIDVIRLMLISFGQKTIIGVRQINLLDEFYASELNKPVTPCSPSPNEAILEDLPIHEP